MSTNPFVQTYRQLSVEVHNAGLVDHRPGFYWTRIGGWVLALAALVVAVFLLGETWYQLIVAALIGVVMAQLGLLSHEAAHQQVFTSRVWNVWTARVLAGLFIGLSFSWWIAKHNSHHAHPNKEGEDPDVGSRVLAFTPEASDRRTGIGARLAKHQGTFFVPLLLLEGLNLHYASLKTLLTTPGVPFRLTEIAFILIRHTALLALVFTVLPGRIAIAFIGVQVGVFGLMLGGAFALNHIGMPTVPANAQIDFLRRQVRMSRNIDDGPLVRFLMGGLQFQIEHHLFPKAPRPSLPALQKLVRKHCEDLSIPYTQRSLSEASTTVISYLNQVGLKNRDPYVCPLVQRYRG